MISGEGRAMLDDLELFVSAGDVLEIPIGCKHTLMADTELKVIEVQIGEDLTVHDKIKHEL